MTLDLEGKAHEKKHDSRMNMSEFQTVKEENDKLHRALLSALDDLEKHRGLKDSNLYEGLSCSTSSDRRRRRLRKLEKNQVPNSSRLLEDDLLSEETDKLTEEFMQELNLLQQALDEKERENDELDSKVKQLSKDLTSTTKEIENRTSALVDAVARIEVLEKKIADANKKILSKEVIIGDLTKEKKSLGELVHTKEEKIQQLENKLRLSFTLKQEEQMLEKKLQARLDDTEKRCALLATQLEKALSAIEIFHSQSKDAKQEYYAFIERTTKDNETLKLKMAKRETKMKKLNAQVVILTKQKDQLEKEKRQVEVGTKVKVEDQQEFKEKTQSIEKFRLELEQSRKDLDQERMNSVLVKKELCRLREQLILSEERRKTDVRRQEQLIRGKEQEVQYIWQKYLQQVLPHRTCQED